MTVKELLILLAENNINANISINTGNNINEEISSVDIWSEEYFSSKRIGGDLDV